MSSELSRNVPEIADPEEIGRSFRQLDRSASWYWWNTVLGLCLLTATWAAMSLPEPLLRSVVPRDFDMSLLVKGLLALMLLSNGYTLFHQRHLKLFRDSFAKQMQIAGEQRMRADKFYGLAILDPLTGLYNRRYGEECLKNEIVRAERNSYDLAVLVMDLDHFKEINDQYGHAAGDIVLQEFSRRLKRAIRACDVPVRIGGDEFLVVLPECPRENVEIILSRLKPFEVIVNRQKVTVSYSRGRSQYQVADTPQTLVQRADEVLYEEKANRPEVAMLQEGAANPSDKVGA